MAEDKSSVYERSGRVVLAISGYHGLPQAHACVPTAVELFRSLRSCEFVVDLRDMSGFDTGSRVIWQQHLQDFRLHIHTVTIVGGSPLARMSGAAVCLYAGIKMKFATTLDEAFQAPMSRRASG
jgi:hypothetical protein